MRFFSATCPLLLLLATGRASADDAAKLYLKGSGWFQFGQILHSSDTLSSNFNYNDNWVQNSGAQFTVIADIDENLQGAMGLGGLQIHNAQGTIQKAREMSLGFSPYITQARLTWVSDTREYSPFIIDFGLFPYQYNPDARNLGAYLFRGPVYPGTLISEFESQSLDTTVGNILGFKFRNNIGKAFTQDLIIRSETDFPPVFDLSLGYVAAFRLGEVLEIGAGANFYRLLPMRPKATKLTDREGFQIIVPDSGGHPYDGNYAYVDPVTGDTTLLSHQGIKLMGRIAFDPKPWIGSDALGPRDLKLYAEAGVIGVKDYPGVYPSIGERIPLMVGLNLPTFKLLDEAVLEVEYYKAPFRDDYRRLIAENSPIPMNNHSYTPAREDSSGTLMGTNLPFGDPYDVTRMHKDDLKWSLYLSKTFAGCAKLSVQAANDHYRPNTQLNSDATTVERLESAFTTMKDWYVMARLGFFF